MIENEVLIKMTKRKRMIFLGLFVIIVIIAGFSLATQTDDDPELHQFVKDSQDITGLNIQTEEPFSLEQLDQEWIVKDRLEVTDQEATNEALLSLMNWQGEEVDVPRKEVGLDFPKISVQLTYQDGQQHSLMIGQLNPAGTGYYVEDRQAQSIYLVERTLIEAFPFYVQAYLDTGLLTLQIGEIEHIFIDNGTEEIHLTNQSPYPEQETRTNITGWFIESPYQLHYHTAYSRIEALLHSIQTLSMEELIAENATDWSTYGLDDSNFTIEFVTSSEHVRLLIGDPASFESYYAKIEGEDRVFTILNQQLEPFSYQAKHYHDGYVKILALDVMSRLEIVSKELELSVSIEHSEDEETVFKIDDTLIDVSMMRDAYKAVASLSAAGMADQPVYQGPDVLIRSTILTDDGEKVIEVEFVDYDQDHYAAFIDDSCDFIVAKTDVEAMLDTMASLLK